MIYHANFKIEENHVETVNGKKISSPCSELVTLVTDNCLRRGNIIISRFGQEDEFIFLTMVDVLRATEEFDGMFKKYENKRGVNQVPQIKSVLQYIQ